MQFQFEFGKKTYVMGILNATPDSFSDGGQYLSVSKAVTHAEQMVREGADIIDVGGESTRPGATPVCADEEIARVIPVIEGIRQVTDTPISIDTYKASVAEAALASGAQIINDVWGFQKDREMAKVAAAYNVPAILMHNQVDTHYAGDIVAAIKAFFETSLKIAEAAGVAKHQIVLDPGIGFGKNLSQNLEVMRRLDEICALGYPVLLGTSRKSMIGKVLDLPAHERLVGTLVTTAMGIQSGVEIVRVHDIQANVRACRMADAIVRGGQMWTG